MVYIAFFVWILTMVFQRQILDFLGKKSERSPEYLVRDYEDKVNRAVEKLNKERREQNLPEITTVYDYVEYKQYLWEQKIDQMKREGKRIPEPDRLSEPRALYRSYLCYKKYVEKTEQEAQLKAMEEKAIKQQEEDAKNREDSYYDSCL